jgi:hypothetical protein
MRPMMRRGRPATGSLVRDEQGRAIGARVTLPGGSRRVVPFKEPLPDDRAKILAANLARRAREAGYVPADTTETVAEWSERWLEEREGRGLTSTKDDKSRLKLHVLPTLGTLAMGMVTRNDVEGLVEALDAKVRAGTISWKTARHAWALVTRMFRDAKASKKRDLRCLVTGGASSPLPSTPVHEPASLRRSNGRTSTSSAASYTSIVPPTASTVAPRGPRRVSLAGSRSSPISSRCSPR